MQLCASALVTSPVVLPWQHGIYLSTQQVGMPFSPPHIYDDSNCYLRKGRLWWNPMIMASFYYSPAMSSFIPQLYPASFPSYVQLHSPAMSSFIPQLCPASFPSYVRLHSQAMSGFIPQLCPASFPSYVRLHSPAVSGLIPQLYPASFRDLF